MSTFKRAPKATENLLSKVLREHYEELHELTKEKKGGLTFDLLEVHADLDANGEPVGRPIKHHGTAAYAVIKAVPKADRALGRSDVEIRIDGDAWNELEEEVQEALIDHELYHLVLVRKDGLPSRDDLGRYRFKMREHDYEFGWFVEVAARRGLASIEVQQAGRMMKKHGQILFGFAEREPDADQTKFPFVVRGDEPAPNEALDGKELLWDQLNELQQEEASDKFGNDLEVRGLFIVSHGGQVLSQKTIAAEPEAPAANEQEAPAKPKRQRNKAASKGK